MIAAPVAGHIFSVFHRFCGGKGIAVSFGCLLGLLPDIGPVLLLAVNFIFFSLVIRVTPHYYRTVCTYGFTVLGALLMIKIPEFHMGILMIAILIQGKLAFSQEKKEKCRVSVLWKS